jgi:hypothetical protein
MMAAWMGAPLVQAGLIVGDGNFLGVPFPSTSG